MPNKVKKARLPRIAEAGPRHRFLLLIPIALYNRMIEEHGLRWGKMTPFILQAITEKMERDATSTNKVPDANYIRDVEGTP